MVIQLKLKQEEATPLTATTDSISALLEHVQTRWSRLPALSFTGKELPEVVLSNTLTGGFRYINTAGVSEHDWHFDMLGATHAV